MVESLKNRVRSERGASLSFALFVFLVCAMASAVVLSAATAASGQYVELGKSDQRYYAVVSAANLLRGSMAEGDEIGYEVVETRTGTIEARTGDGTSVPESLPKNSDLYPVLYQSITRTPASSSSFDFLKAVTLFGLYGTATEPNTATSRGNNWEAVTPFANSWWPTKKGANNYAEGTLTLDPSMENGVTAEATVRIYDNWLVEVVVSNQTEAADERFSLYMAYQGTCKQGAPSISSRLGDTTVSGASSLSNLVEVVETRTTTVTWQLMRVMPGRGFTNG